MNAITPPPQFPIAERGAGVAPLRRPGSVRRTTSITSRWPGGQGTDAEMIGRARDIATPFDSDAPVRLAEGGFAITASSIRQILSLVTDPRHPREAEMIGVRGGGASRHALLETMGDIEGSPLFQLLDDYAGASLVANWIWTMWDLDWVERMRAALAEGVSGMRPMLNICSGFAEGSSALDRENRPSGESHRTSVIALDNPADPEGWHKLPPLDGPMTQRARRMDLWRDGSSIRVDAGFQDSGSAPDGGRVAIHEYRVHAVIDADTHIVQSLQALPLILPFPECPAASINASRMVGQPVGTFRERVIEMLPGTEGCTHLNDVLRALADVPALAKGLPRVTG